MAANMTNDRHPLTDPLPDIPDKVSCTLSPTHAHPCPVGCEMGTSPHVYQLAVNASVYSHWPEKQPATFTTLMVLPRRPFPHERKKVCANSGS